MNIPPLPMVLGRGKIHNNIIQPMSITTYDAYTRLSTMEAARLTNFIHGQQEEPKSSPRAIAKAIQYSTKEIPGLGGYVFVLEEQGEIMGLMVVNKTGMGDYIPENFIAFLTVRKGEKDKGVAQKLMDYALQYCKGDLAIHIEGQGKQMDLLKENSFRLTHMEMRLNR